MEKLKAVAPQFREVAEETNAFIRDQRFAAACQRWF